MDDVIVGKISCVSTDPEDGYVHFIVESYDDSPESTVLYCLKIYEKIK